MNDDEMREWGRVEFATRLKELEQRTPEGLRIAQQNAKQGGRMKITRQTLTAEYLRSRLNYDPETGVFVWAGSRELSSNRRAGNRAGSVNREGYRMLNIHRTFYAAHRLAWLYVHGEWPANELDHINGMRDDNRIANLRVADRFINTQNVAVRKTNRSGFAGVSFYKPTGMWKAQIRHANKTHHLGYFPKPEDAHAAYVQAKFSMHKGFIGRGILPASGEK